MPAAKHDLAMLARLKPGVTLQQAQAETTMLYRSWLEQSPDTNKNPKVRQA